jgi:hypothetical protein
LPALLLGSHLLLLLLLCGSFCSACICCSAQAVQLPPVEVCPRASHKELVPAAVAGSLLFGQILN